MSPLVILFSNKKGGVGKSTLTRELGSYMAYEGHKTLLIDCDSQGNLSKGLIRHKRKGPEGGLYEALTGGEIKLRGLKPGLSLLAGDIRLSAFEKNISGEPDAFFRLKQVFEEEMEVFKDYEFIFIDTPPTLEVLTINALCICDHLIIPMNPTLYSMEGANALLYTITKIRRSLNPHINLLGVIINSYDRRPLITQAVKEEIEGAFGKAVFKNHLSRSVKIEEAIAAKEGLIYSESLKGSKSRQEVMALGKELKTRLGL